MSTALYWLVQRRDPKQPNDPFAWVAVFDCRVPGKALTAPTQAKAIAVAKAFAATQTPRPLPGDMRVVRAYSLTATDLGYV